MESRISFSLQQLKPEAASASQTVWDLGTRHHGMFIYLKIYFCFIYVYAWVYHVVVSSQGGQKRAPDPLALE